MTGEPRVSSIERITQQIHKLDGVIELKRAAPSVRAIPYDEVSRRLQARPK